MLVSNTFERNDERWLPFLDGSSWLAIRCKSSAFSNGYGVSSTVPKYSRLLRQPKWWLLIWWGSRIQGSELI